MNAKTEATKKKAPKTQKVPDEGQGNVVTHPVTQDEHEEDGIRWQEPYPTEGMVKVELLEDHGISEGRLVKQYSKGSVVTIDASLAHSIHKSIKGV